MFQDNKRHLPDDNPYASPQAVEQGPRLDEIAALAAASRPRGPSYARWVVLFFLCTLALVLYVDRVCIGQAEKSMREDLGLTKEHMGWIFNAFMIAYCVLEVPTGHWGDRFGSRRVITRIVLWWSAFTALTGLAFGFWPLMAIRFLFGAGEAGAFPNAARVVTRWFPDDERGFARGAITTTSQIGGAIAPPLAAFLIGLVDWRLTFMSFGALGLVWAFFFYRWFRDEPGEHPAVSAAELAHIGKPPAHDDEHPSIPWGQVVLSPNVWLMGAIQTVGATLFYMLFQWYPTYLKEARQLSEQTSGWFTMIALSGGAVGCLMGGFLSDQIIRRTSERRWTRRATGCAMLGLAAVSMWGVRYVEHPLTASVLCASALFCLQVSIPTWWTVVAEISGRHGAAMFGLMNGMGGLGVMVLNALVGRIVDSRVAAGIPLADTWRPVFDGVAIALAVGASCWLLVDATRPIFRRQEGAA
ncbi:MAG TPA: MFS transporter [Pirellulaceae bacterium]|nr:MFS transporter [Pirellulaceae bacterium]